jgi:hypothetical protein
MLPVSGIFRSGFLKRWAITSPDRGYLAAMAAPLSLWQKILAFLFPVSIRKGSSALNPALELFYYQGRYLLATPDAVYSDGDKYRPLLMAFKWPALKPYLKDVRSVLVLGTGLASAVHILDAKRIYPQLMLVEIDALVLEWAKEFLPANSAQNVTTINDDAFNFISVDTTCYDLIIVDIFFGREVPEAVTESTFLKQCKARLNTDGFLVLNYMARPNESEGTAKAALEATFSKVTEIGFGINKVYIASA